MFETHHALQPSPGSAQALSAAKVIAINSHSIKVACSNCNLRELCMPVGLSKEEFDLICDRFTNYELFKVDKNGKLLRDSTESLIKVNYDNQRV